jgi:hypothetical protein
MNVSLVFYHIKSIGINQFINELALTYAYVMVT